MLTIINSFFCLAMVLACKCFFAIPSRKGLQINQQVLTDNSVQGIVPCAEAEEDINVQKICFCTFIHMALKEFVF